MCMVYLGLEWNKFAVWRITLVDYDYLFAVCMTSTADCSPGTSPIRFVFPLKTLTSKFKFSFVALCISHTTKLLK